MSSSGAPIEAEIAHAISECMSLLFLFAAPRVYTAVRKSGGAGLDGPASQSALRRFLKQASGIRARAGAPKGDTARLVDAAMIVEEIAGVLGAQPLTDPLPATVVARARHALSVLGFEEPTGGWEDFEGFSVPSAPLK
jgi:hypothetical protein